MKLNKLCLYKANHNEAIKTVQSFRLDLDIGEFVEWFLVTDENPYQFMPKGWTSAASNAQDAASFLQCLHHAVVDDGEVTFIKVRGKPRIVFSSHYDEGFRERALTAQEMGFGWGYEVIESGLDGFLEAIRGE